MLRGLGFRGLGVRGFGFRGLGFRDDAGYSHDMHNGLTAWGCSWAAMNRPVVVHDLGGTATHKAKQNRLLTKAR